VSQGGLGCLLLIVAYKGVIRFYLLSFKKEKMQTKGMVPSGLKEIITKIIRGHQPLQTKESAGARCRMLM